MTMDDMDTPEVRDGAVQYVGCPNCGADPGTPCRLNAGAWTGRALRGFAHIGRRMEYHAWRDIFGPPTKSWEFSIQDPHRPEVQTLPPCALPRPHCARCSQCECGALLADHAGVRKRLAKEEALPPLGKVSTSNVDDLLG